MSIFDKLNPKNWVNDHSGSASFLHGYSEETTTFGGESGKLARFASFRKLDLADVDGKVVLGNGRNGVVLQGKGSLLGLEIKSNTDYISSTIPKVSGSAQLNTVKLETDASLRVGGKDHKILSGTVTGPGVSVSASAGGKSVVPTGSAKAYVGSAKGELGYDDHKIASFSTSLGPSASTELDLLNAGDDSPLKSKVDDSHIGDSFSVSAPGIAKGEFKKTDGYAPGFKTDHSTDNIASRLDDVDALRKHDLIAEANLQHKQNDNVFTKHPSWFAKNRYDRVADKSQALNNRLTEQIDSDKAKRQAIDNQLNKPDLSEKERAHLLNRRDKLDDNINKMSECRNNLTADRDKANDFRNRDNNRDLDRNGPRRTEDLVNGAKAYSQNFDDKLSSMQESGKLPKDYADQLSTSARGIHRAQNDLAHRSNQYDRQLNYYNGKIDQIGKERDAYLKSKGMTPQEAIANKDKKYADFNNYEKNLRDKTANIRQQKGECQKALLETDKLRGNKDSEELRAKGRQLESDKIDNANAKAAKDDEIANYCNTHGITRDPDGEYLKNIDDRGLQKLVDERKSLDGQGDNIQRDLDINKGAVAKGDNSGITVTDDKGFPAIKKVNDKAVAQAKDNADIRNGKAAELEAAEQQNNAEQQAAPLDDGADQTMPPPPPPGGRGSGTDDGNGESDNADGDIKPQENESNESAQNDEIPVNTASVEGEGTDAVNEAPSAGEENEPAHNEESVAGNAVEEATPKEETAAEDEEKETSPEDESRTDAEGEESKSDDESQTDGEGKDASPEEDSQGEDNGEETEPEESQDKSEGEDTVPAEETQTGDDTSDDTSEEENPDEEENRDNEPEENQTEGQETAPEGEEPVSNGVDDNSVSEDETRGEDIEDEPEEDTQSEGEEGPETNEDQTQDQDQDQAQDQEDNYEEQPADQESEEQSDEENLESDGQENSDEISAVNADEIGGGQEEGSGGMSTTSAEEPSSEPEEESGGMSTTGFGGDMGNSYGSSEGMSTTSAAESPGESESSSEGMATTASGESESAPEVSSGESMDSGHSM